jgi:osmotically inducible protein OsmC
MPVRKAHAEWEGNLFKGKGKMEFGSFKGAFSAASRFEDGQGSNPEELLGAAHAGCFSMALSHELDQKGFPPKRVSTHARVHIEKVGEGFSITCIELETEAEVPKIDAKTFHKIAEGAKRGCPVSQALRSVTIELKATLK